MVKNLLLLVLHHSAYLIDPLTLVHDVQLSFIGNSLSKVEWTQQDAVYQSCVRITLNVNFSEKFSKQLQLLYRLHIFVRCTQLPDHFHVEFPFVGRYCIPCDLE